MASTSKVIRISQDKYDKIVSEGKMTETFDTVLGRIMERAELMGASDVDTSVAKFTKNERNHVKSLVATLTIKRMPESEILEEIHRLTQKVITRKSLYNLKQAIKRDSFNWYSQLRQGQYEYLHEFKERVDEVIDLQRKAQQLFADNAHNPAIQLDAIAELRKLNVLLSNYISVAPHIGNVASNDITIPTIPEHKTEYDDEDIIV